MSVERRIGERHLISFPIRVEWKDEKGEEIVEEGLTENIGPGGALIHLPRLLPNVGSKVNITVTENSATNQVTVIAQVIRLERNVAHPQAALMLLGSNKDWEKNVWQYAGDVIAAQKPDSFDDWN
ncbi:MAG TPA: PilZ domain-containing protein [Pyrinomonadaceae bacterium]|nr:PilZ domain-containing protein [Pyrinomonadaceae bacterium]